MRTLLLTLGLLTLSANAHAQVLARAETVAQVRIPEFLSVKTGTVSEQVLANGTRSRRVTLYVTANSAWSLAIARTCQSSCGNLTIRVASVGSGAPAGNAGVAQGDSGNDLPVVVEYQWDRGTAAPGADEFQYLLSGV